jgi:hypothetical protein
MARFTTENASAFGKRKSGKGRPKPRSQILRMQAMLLKDAENPNTPAHLRASSARAWDVLEERLRIMSGKPLPGQLRPELEQMRKLKRKQSELLSAFAQGPIEEPPAAAS